MSDDKPIMGVVVPALGTGPHRPKGDVPDLSKLVPPPGPSGVSQPPEVERHDCVTAIATSAREQSPGESDDHIVAATVAGSAMLTEELMRTARERDAARAELDALKRDQTTRVFNCPQCGYHMTTNDDARMLEAQRDAYSHQCELLTAERDRFKDENSRLCPIADLPVIDSLKAQLSLTQSELAQERERREKLSALLDGVADAIKGPAPKLTLHGWHDLPKLVAEQRVRAEKAEAALVAARDLLKRAQVWVARAHTTFENIDEVQDVYNEIDAALAYDATTGAGRGSNG